MEHLSEGQQEAVLMFEEITQISDHQLCVQILSQNGWNVDVAVDNFIQGRTSTSTGGGGHGSTGNTGTGTGTTNGGSSNSSSSSGTNNSSTGNGNGSSSTQLADANANPLDILLNPFKWFFQSRPPVINPQLDTRKFIENFDQTYSPQHPTFHEGSYATAAVAAHRASKFLLIYLHSPMHEDTERFCTQTFCTQSVSQFANENAITWAGSVFDTEAYALSNQLRTTSFPFVALLMCQNDRTVQVLDRVQGCLEEEELVERLQNIIQANRAHLTRINAEITRREESTRLREQQDREFREAEEAAQRERERRQEEERQRLQREEEERQQQELAAAIELSHKLSRESNTQERRIALGDEPAASTTDAATIRFQLPQGSKISRRFLKTDPVQRIYDFLLVYFYDQASEISRIMVSTHFPKVDLTEMNQTVGEAGLFPRGMLYVQNLDA